MSTALGTRGWRRYAAPVVATLLLSGCADGGSDEELDLTLGDDPVTLHMAWWGNDDRAQRTTAALEDFMAEYPNITVTTQSADFNAYWEQIATRIAAGDMPDVVQMQSTYIASYVDNDTLLDLERVGSIVDMSSIPSEVTDLGRVNGTLYGIAYGYSAPVFLANPRIFDELGVEMPDDESWTWQDLTDLASEITEASGGTYVGVDTSMLEPFRLINWARQHGEQLFDADGEVAVSAATVADYWHYYLDLQASGGSLPASEMIERWNAGQSAYPVMTGQAALGDYNSVWVERGSEASGDTLVLLRPPGTPGGESGFYLKEAGYWSIAAGTEHPAEAALLIDWLLNSEEALGHLGTDRGLPVNTGLREAYEPKLSDTDRAQVAYLDEVFPLLGPPYTPPPPGSDEVNSLFQRYGEQVMLGQISPEEAADAFVDELQSVIERAG